MAGEYYYDSRAEDENGYGKNPRRTDEEHRLSIHSRLNQWFGFPGLQENQNFAPSTAPLRDDGQPQPERKDPGSVSIHVFRRVL